MGIMSEKQEVLQKVKEIKKAAEELLIDVDKLENDPLFVIYIYDDVGLGIGTQEIYEWFYENNMIGKLESVDFSLSSMLHLRIVGFRFKDAADATAFKLRWT